jgi:hypothetical protein
MEPHNLQHQKKQTVGILYFQQFYLYLIMMETAQPAASTRKSKLLGYFYFQIHPTCTWIMMVMAKPNEPTKVNCWDTLLSTPYLYVEMVQLNLQHQKK